MADVKLRINMESESGSENYDVDIRNGLKSVESLSQSSPDASGIFYGATEGAGSAEIVDVDGKLNTFIADGLIDNSNLPVTILANSKEVQKHISTDSTYNKNSKMLSVRLGNRLNTLDILKYGGYPYPEHSENVANILFDVLSNLRYALFGEDKELTHEEFVEMLSDKHDKDSTLYEYLTSIVNEYPFIESGKTYKDVINEFCIVGQMQMFIDDDDKIRFVSARPKVFDDGNEAIHIEKKNMFSQLDHSVILKNKYDGVEATVQNVTDVTDYDTLIGKEVISCKGERFTPSVGDYISASELTTDSYNFGKASYTPGFVDYAAISYVKIKNIYKSGVFYVPYSDKMNLLKTRNLQSDVYKDDVARYEITYTKEERECYATKTSFSDDTFSDDLIIPYFDAISESESQGLYQTEITHEVDLVVDNSGWVATSTTTIKDNSTMTIVRDDENQRFVVEYNILAGQYAIKIGTNSTNTSATNIRMEGVIELYNAKQIELSLYGDVRTISFESVSSSTSGIESAKTKVSIGASSFIQTEEIASTIKNNILGDYISGVSNGTVKVSCSDYYNQNGEKVIDWTRGQILQVNQVVYFDGDTYQGGSQRYWKIKGRKFQKTGVPFVDLELEEVVVPRALQNYSWEDISKISELGMAKDMFSIGDEKTFRLSNGLDVVAQVVDFDADTKEDGSGKAGITFGLKYLLNESVETTNIANWESSTLREYVGSLITVLPESLKNSIKSVTKRATATVVMDEMINFGVYPTNDKLWLFSRSEVFGKTSGQFDYEESEQYAYWKDNNNSKIKIIIGGLGASSWWLRSGVYSFESGILKTGMSIVTEGGELGSMVLPQTNTGIIGSSRICFGFCI